MTQIISGKEISEKLRENIRKQVEELSSRCGKQAGLAVVLVGDNPASHIYVSNKVKQTKEVGMHSFEYRMHDSVTEEKLLQKIDSLNQNPDIHGILVQLPLPAHISEEKVIQAIAPHKDVDGFHAINRGKLVVGDKDALVACTPLGCMEMLEDFYGDKYNLRGLDAVVIGRSNIVGKPMTQLLINASVTVTCCNSSTQDVKALTQKADIIVTAVGKPKFFDYSYFSEKSVIIDVGINRIEQLKEDGTSISKICGDVDYDDCFGKVKAITPVPGGVGPMTIACLLKNTLTAFKAIERL